ncbi:MAG: hypothetical protein IPP34_09090 [Bacteroidetes bacterium]|nr:hypothetical protein [Bacteroidota bacterium]
MIRRSAEIVPEKQEMISGYGLLASLLFQQKIILCMMNLQNHFFFYSNKRRPEKYLDPEIRNGISSFTAFSDPDELKSGLIQLEKISPPVEIADIMKNMKMILAIIYFISLRKN